MANKILMPKLSPTMEEGQISRWLKAEGDEIEANETIAEVDTDKATMEMTSLEPGTLLKIIVPAGENARLGQTIGIIGKAGEDFAALLDEPAAEKPAAPSEPKAEEKPAEAAPAQPAQCLALGRPARPRAPPTDRRHGGPGHPGPAPGQAGPTEPAE